MYVPELSYHSSKHPHADWLYLASNITPKRVADFAEKLSLKTVACPLGKGWFLTSETHAFSEHPVLLFEGVCNVGEAPISGHSHAIKKTDGAWLSKARGCFTAIHHHADKIELVTDQLGLGVIYKYEGPNGDLIYSNRMHMLALSLKMVLTCKAKLNPLAVASGFAFNMVFTHLGILEGVKILPANTKVIIKGSGVTEQSLPNTHNPAHGNYQDLLVQAAGEIRQNILAANTLAEQSRTQNVLRLSGGLDSRIVLAGIMATGTDNNTARFTYGKHDSPDRDIADRLAMMTGIKFVDPYAAPIDETPEAVLEVWNSLVFGAHTLTQVRMMQTPYVIMSGIMGEIFRSFYEDTLNDRGVILGPETTIGQIADQILEYFAPGKALLKPEALDAAKACLRAELEDIERGFMADESVMGTNLASHCLYQLYQRFRCRFHYGTLVRFSGQSNLQTVPLYSLTGEGLRRTTLSQAHATGQVPLDLIMELDQRLAFIKTVKEDWAYKASRTSIHKATFENAELHSPERLLRPPAKRSNSLSANDVKKTLLTKLKTDFPRLLDDIEQTLPGMLDIDRIQKLSERRSDKWIMHIGIRCHNILFANQIT